MKPLVIVFLILLSGSSSIAQTLNRYDIIIDEIFPDPSPVVGLPNAEFIELKNVSKNTINLLNWQISDGSSTATIKINYQLKPDSFVVICPSSAANDYAKFGPTIAVSNFPSLNNDGDEIYLKSPQGMIVHAISFNLSWYQNEIKNKGGWTLEMIDTKNPCAGLSNWKSSMDNKGGTPSQINSVDGINRDVTAPVLQRTYTIDNSTIVAVFDEPIDSAYAADISHYKMDKGIGHPISASPKAPLFYEVVLTFAQPLDAQTIYTLSTNEMMDCVGNRSSENTAKAGLPSLPEANDMVVNEILFNPKPNGYTYVEFYNRSKKIIDLKHVYIASRNSTGALKSIYPIAGTASLFFPEEYITITENKIWLEQNYLVKYPDKVMELASLPSLPDKEGIIVLLNENQIVIDELHYDHQWHFALISGEDGIALERIDFNQPTQNQSNWSSAASTVGYGTPSYQNSQFKSGLETNNEITISPKIFSPDNDGYEDFCFIHYQVPNAGYLGNITIYDAAGRMVRHLANNATLATEGSLKWDGLDEKQKALPVGIYVIVTQIFDLNGRTKQFKHAVTIARRL
jgi:hypothetical protein